MGDFIGDDDYDYRPRQRSPRGYYNEYRRSGTFLNPGRGSGLQRTRSTGHQPAPNIYIYNDQLQDANQRADAKYTPPPPPQAPMPGAFPGYPAAAPAAYPVPYPAAAYPAPAPYPAAAYPATAPPPAAAYPPSPERRGRSHGRLGDDLVDDLAELALKDRARSRTRSRGRSDVTDSSADFYEWKLREKEREVEEERRRQLWEKEAELKRMKEDDKRRKSETEHEREQKRIIQDYEERLRKEKAAQKEAEEKMIAKMKKDKEDAEEEEREMREKFKREEREKKEKEERQYEEFLEKQRKKKEKEDREKKEEKERFEREMRKRLEQFGYTQSQIEYMVDEEKAKKAKERSRSGTRVTETNTLQIWNGGERRPVYPKVHRDYLSVDTLIYYDIPYEFDRADPNYIIIRREMDKYETEILFEHTRRLRSGAGKLLIEAPKDEKQYAWYRKRDRSRSRVRKVGILEVKKVI